MPGGMTNATADSQPSRRAVGLPAQPGPLVGRAGDVERVRGQLRRDEVRLLTLVGPAGTGKTRQTMEVAGQLTADFSDGVWFVDLAPVRDAGLVPSAIAATLDVREDRGRPLIDTLRDALGDRRTLLLLDNFEQVLPAAPYLADLLRTCAQLKLLVTSRAPLRLQWEHELAVDPLEVPDLAALPNLEALVQVPSVALLLQRTQRIDSIFRVDDSNARETAEICVRLDGLPLAIELAAARMRVLPPRALLGRLRYRLVDLASGPRDQPELQRTLRAALDWSYEQLDPAEQALFRRLGVFVGGFALEAAAEVCDPDGQLGLDPLRGLESLIEKSLVRTVDAGDRDEPRFGLLETIRAYALEELDRRGELALLRRRHAMYYLGGADVVVDQISNAHQAIWLRILETEHDNLRAALAWCEEAGEPELGLRASGLLAWFWQVRGHVGEGRARMAALLAFADRFPAAIRADGLRVAASLALSQTDDRAARALYEESLAIRRALGAPAGLLAPLSGLGYTAMHQGDDETAQACFEEALGIQQQLGDRLGMAESFNSLANLAHGRGDLARARLLYEQSVVIDREIGYRVDVVEHNLGVVAQEQGDLTAARGYFASSIAVRRALGDAPGLALSLAKLGEVVAAEGDLGEAQRVLLESLMLQRDLGDRAGLAFVLERMAMLATRLRLHDRALRLAGASAALREQLGVPLGTAARIALEGQLAASRRALRAEAADHAWQQGRALHLPDVIALALDTPNGANDASTDTAGTVPLTAREREVATLVARGLTNRQIGAELVIAERTVDVHVSNILNKLTLTSRTQLATWALRQGLLG